MNLKNKKIVVIGGTGAIGRVLVDKLKKKGVLVEAWDSRNHDVRDKSLLNFEGVWGVFHLAAKMSGEKKEIFRVNVEGVRNVMEKAVKQGVKKIVYVSSVMVFEDTGEIARDEDWPIRKNHTSVYAQSKIEALGVVRRFFNKIETVIVYPSVVLPKESGWLKPGSIMSLVGDGRRLVNYVGVERVAELMIRAMKYGNPGEAYILGGKNIRASDYFWLGKLVRIPEFVAKLFIEEIPANMAFTGKKINSIGK